MTTYCEPDDLLIGQIKTRMPPTISLDDFCEQATNEINAKLGFVYAIPFIDPVDENVEANKLPVHQWALIRDIAIKLASGRVVLAATAVSQDTTIHAYGLYLVKDAHVSLMAIANGDVRLKWPRVNSEGDPLDPAPNPQDTDPYAFVPGAENDDAYSATKAFENNFMRPSSWPFAPEPWSPGA